MGHEEERKRIVIEGVDPEIDGGRFPIRRVVGDKVVVEADIFACALGVKEVLPR